MTLLCWCVLAAQHVSAQPRWYRQESEPRIDSLISRMTLLEKVGQLNQIGGDRPAEGRPAAVSDAMKGVLRRGMVGAFLGVTGAERTHELQRIAVEESRLHIPLLFGLDVIHGYRTTFPIPLGEAATWDTVVVERSARVAATEAAAAGVDWTFGPMVDIARDPRWGRIAEGSGEDPVLGSAMAAARVRGFQGTSFRDPTAILACAKHFAAYGGAEGGRDYNTVDFSERLLRDIYLPPFRAAVNAGAATLMTSFNEIAGIPSTANKRLLTGILRDEWGFKGFVVSDWTAIQELEHHGIAATPSQAALEAIRAGTEMDMMSELYADYLPDLVHSGVLPVQVLDEAVRRVLRVKFALGLFDDPYRYARPDREESSMLTPESRAAARKDAGESIVLLKNDGGLLPLTNDARRIAVIGPLAENVTEPLGPWRGMGRPSDAVSVLAGMRARSGNAARILYAPGCDSTFGDSTGFSLAARTASRADIVVLVVGETADMSGEAASRSDIGLPGVQESLVRRIAAVGRPVVLVMMNGRPLCIPWEVQHLAAIVETWFPGVEAGNAVADVLWGDVNPSGKLPVTFPRSVGQIPIYYNHKNTGRPCLADDKYTSKYLDLPNTPQFPFGFGLSYTTFSYSNLKVSPANVAAHGTIRCSVDVKNTGSRKGDEVVELYIRDEVASVTRPVLELKGFRRVTLGPGETSNLEFSIDADHLGFYDEEMHYVVEPGTFQAYVGGSSDQTLDAEFTLGAQ